jgi:hypothetical protein
MFVSFVVNNAGLASQLKEKPDALSRLRQWISQMHRANEEEINSHVKRERVRVEVRSSPAS